MAVISIYEYINIAVIYGTGRIFGNFINKRAK
jgi:hypothetical protein